MLLKIIATPTSITVVDDFQNRIIVHKTKTGIEFYSTVNNEKANKKMLALQNEIKRVIMNPTDNRDNYRVRFERLAKSLTDIKTHSFVSLKNHLAVS